MNTLQVPANAQVILVNGVRRFYVVYDNKGNAHTFHNDNGYLADHSIHKPNPDGNPCEFLGGNPCTSDGRSTGQIHRERAIFALLQEGADRVNALVHTND